ncbi:Rrf2 family transcriptional regulator [Acetobacter sp.]|uniref:RrF2 family transcriptional regulator n=1 Tax=Acetobacter sp. TaxID=440 RepID=UPI00258325A4|nr:Rrf2 family transcriptional regulator [Acetobacter sp.]MCC6105877.1 Rrf2 family transcriptional regulator [Acetobacter sp.]
MRLTLYTDYALRTLLYLGVHADRRVSIREVAEAYGISENHLVKVIHHLGRGGFVDTLRGRGGGLMLARPADQINVGDVVRHTEEDMALVGCMSPLSPGMGPGSRSTVAAAGGGGKRASLAALAGSAARGKSSPRGMAAGGATSAGSAAGEGRSSWAGGCLLANACHLRGVLGEALGAFMTVLDARTLADLLTPYERKVLTQAGPAEAPVDAPKTAEKVV